MGILVGGVLAGSPNPDPTSDLAWPLRNYVITGLAPGHHYVD